MHLSGYMPVVMTHICQRIRDSNPEFVMLEILPQSNISFIGLFYIEKYIYHPLYGFQGLGFMKIYWFPFWLIVLLLGDFNNTLIFSHSQQFRNSSSSASLDSSTEDQGFICCLKVSLWTEAVLLNLRHPMNKHFCLMVLVLDPRHLLLLYMIPNIKGGYCF